VEEEKPKKELVHFIQLLNAILEVQRKWGNKLVITPDESDEEYVSYIFEFDFGVEKFSSYILVYKDQENTAFDEVKLIAELDEIEMKAKKVNGDL